MTQQINVLRTRDDREIPVAGTYTIDSTHTSVEFIGRHLMITKVRGRLPDVSGTITIADEPTDSHVEVEIQVATLDHPRRPTRREPPERRLLRRRALPDHHLPVHEGRARRRRQPGC